MKNALPPGSSDGIFTLSKIGDHPFIHIIERSIRSRRPDLLRHSIGEETEVFFPFFDLLSCHHLCRDLKRKTDNAINVIVSISYRLINEIVVALSWAIWGINVDPDFLSEEWLSCLIDPVQKLINCLSFKLRLCFTNGFPHKLTIPKRLDKTRIDKCKHMLWPFKNIDDGRCLH